MTEVQGTGQAVELVYQLTAADLKVALRARMLGTPSGRRTRRLLLVSGVMGILCTTALATMPGRTDTARLVGLSVGTVLAFAGLFLLPRLQARQLHRMVAQQGEFRAVADDTGVRLSTRDTDGTSTWQMFPRYSETPELFVLLTADKNSIGLMVLPKRGTSDPANVERLRAILDRHLQRV